ncbi:SUF system Fe-S cluster assembly regulator [Marinicella meishanensis]|uniref:SUF system Fe-S cluster assembly regulator n=1 Tax=Marinicella meishanensis TaxID=2873263 RepID=UPI001CBFC6F8|nr:SUF system Fe-S cluster assembly regulator [Marinicella sp. NBU2979]
MLKMSKLTEYAFMVIMALKKSDVPASAEQVARATGLETPTASKILKQLKKAGLLAAKRGATGGYFLVKSKQDISLHEVIKAMEGGMSLTDCAEDDAACHLTDACYMSAGMKRVNQVILKALESVTVSDILDDQKKITLQIKP